MDEATEKDLDLLEAYLDESLSPWESQHVRARLATDASFAAALHELRTQRDIRAAVWSSIASETSSADAFADSVLSAARKFDRWKRLRRVAFVGSAAAACFLAGWAGHLLLAAQDKPAAIAVASSHPTETVGSPTKLVSTVEGPGAFQVILTDQSGKVLAIQKFTKLDEAQQFANELSRFRSQQEHVRQGQMVLISDEF